MKKYIVLFFILLSSVSEAQENYSKLTQKALKTMWDAKDEEGYKKALEMYEEAFKIYPDSIEDVGLYKAAVLASELKNYDKAFQYLDSLVDIKKDNIFIGWSSITGNYSENEYKNLLSDPRWQILKTKAEKNKKQFYDELKKQENEFYDVNLTNLNNIKDTQILYEKIKKDIPYKSKNKRNYSISFKINDTIKTSFFIHLPQNYNPNQKYALLFFLHGAVRHNALTDYQLAQWNLGGWNRFYTKYAAQNDVILVFPKGGQQYNWMTPDDGFFMIPEMLKLIKKAINVDDDKVFISGHSNGATGSFSYLMKQPTQFAGFYGFNTYPKNFTGGTFVENIKNRSFINFSTDQDYYYPPNANDDFTKLMNEIKADYKEYRYNGFPHWFPEFDESEAAYKILFSDIKNRKRNSFPNEISWEFDNDKYGKADWISEIKLDTIQAKKEWHKELNFRINKWLDYNEKDSLITQNVDIKAFDFPRKSGKIKATYEDNTFRVETSCIKSFSINISPEMVDLDKKVKVYINGELNFNGKVKYNREFMLQNFENNHDRKQIWVNRIKLKV
ncbi:alpha/beta hydrolase-fold protein [Riemerella anatipestifer]|uniref:alpha/beta hydrolase-fold protein n=1 Tax=Riemerella anatipestifer TaxID=34085 RepID=UPI00208EA803|nr:alpha/beta hydrolase-fold protein [Riemerella anatipestifer]MCO4304943.1 alpha/beta hydrolase-fold protein [Riemerella anatipestifer]MCO7353830.1 alpha/beta hydrolase-fold protein [Riemerella anatipestifer]MCQ4040322.1 alpha/beta hydrolase-fold protein [Riemerella anatipestifer]MCT6761928.1 alpha/beta hydrolase-fold protein [Riemerella anatipestifer]MCT6765980.1 alpha/beta hydrolase-fold protein [Riemerella anatipestifer]